MTIRQTAGGRHVGGSVVAALVAVAALLLAAPAAHAEKRVTVEPAVDVDPQGQKVRVRGAGFDPEMGIYVAWCVVPPKGQKPTPCGGGDDRTGESGNSAWISSNPAIGATLATSYGPNGSFDVQILVSRRIGEVDCFKVACAVTTRNDHENTDDRSQDTFTPVRFRGQAGPAPAPPATASPPAAGGNAGSGTAAKSPSSRPGVSVSSPATTGLDPELVESPVTPEASEEVTVDDGASGEARTAAARPADRSEDRGNGRALALLAVPALGGASLLLYRFRRPGITP